MDDVSGLRGQLLDLKQALVSGCEDHWILMAPSSLGELAVICALANAFRRHHGGKICIVVDEAKRPVLNLFPGRFDRVKVAPLQAMRALSTYGIIDPLRFDRGAPINLWINQNGDGRGLGLHELFVTRPGRGGLSFPDLSRYAMRLPWDAPLEPGKAPMNLHIEAAMLADQVGLPPGESVILFPANNTNKPADGAIWNRLATSFAEAGRNVFFCMSGALYRPSGLMDTGRFLDLDASKAVAVSQIAGRTVSGANGLMMLSLLTATDFGVDVLLTDEYCPLGIGEFRPTEPAYSSTFRCSPECVSGLARRYKEWDVSSGQPSLDAIADAIVFGQDAGGTLTA